MCCLDPPPPPPPPPPPSQWPGVVSTALCWLSLPMPTAYLKHCTAAIEKPPLLVCIPMCLFLSSHSTNLSPVVHAFVVCMCMCVCVCVCVHVCMHTKIGISLCLCKCSGLLQGGAPELIHHYIIVVKQELDCFLHKPLPLHASDSHGYYILHNSNI